MQMTRPPPAPTGVPICKEIQVRIFLKDSCVYTHKYVGMRVLDKIL